MSIELEDFDIQDDDSEQLYEHYSITVDKGQTLLRIDKFLMDRLPNVTRNKIQDAIDGGFIKVNDNLVRSNYKVKPLDIIKVLLPEPKRMEEIVPEDIDLDIIYEDDHLLVVNKPAGMVVHPAYQNWSGTLVNALAFHFKDLPKRENGEGNPGLVHRIDKDTSGLLVVAKTELAMSHLSKQFAKHTIERTYFALVWGSVEERSGTIHTKLTRSENDRRVITAVPLNHPLGKEAITHYKVLQNFRYVSLIQCNLETGRTHQIRAHMRHLGHPLFNDTTYGGDKILKGTQTGKFKTFVDKCFKIISRQALHAKSLGFEHPHTKQWVQFTSELPLDFKLVLKKWENYVSMTEKNDV
ncbi:MAG TPA: RluA family pseudouridine synthase [Cytophagales bacterium]|nr:RluA family pseudouridine synthase [Cytophagales bacterium]